jgi:hypothetical protein
MGFFLVALSATDLMTLGSVAVDVVDCFAEAVLTGVVVIFATGFLEEVAVGFFTDGVGFVACPSSSAGVAAFAVIVDDVEGLPGVALAVDDGVLVVLTVLGAAGDGVIGVELDVFAVKGFEGVLVVFEDILFVDGVGVIRLSG